MEKDFYRRIETEITERDEFVEVIKKLQEDYILNDNYDHLSNLESFYIDSGKFKLVEINNMCLLKRIFCKHDYRRLKPTNGHFFVLKCQEVQIRLIIKPTYNKPL